MNIKIREAQESDYAGICSLINNELGYSEVTLDSVSSRLNLMKENKSYHTFVAAVNNEIAGFIGTVEEIAFEFDNNYLRIIALAVSKPYQGQGIGSSLLNYAEEFANSNGISVLTLNSGLQRLKAHDFYEKNGYAKKSYGFSKTVK